MKLPDSTIQYWLFLMPLVSTIVGWLCMWVAAQFLVYRVIPRRQQSLAAEIGKAAGAEFSLADIEKKIVDPEGIKKIMPLVENHVDDFLRNKLKEKMPVIGMFIGDKTIANLKEVFLKEIEELFPQVLTQFTANLRNQVNVEKMIAMKITAVSAKQWGKMLSPALKYFQLAGAVTGFIIGLINVLILVFVK